MGCKRLERHIHIATAKLRWHDGTVAGRGTKGLTDRSRPLGVRLLGYASVNTVPQRNEGVAPGAYRKLPVGTERRRPRVAQALPK